MQQIEKYISPLIQSQFPAFYNEEGKTFIAFMVAYYEWMEQTGNPLAVSRKSLDNFDIDTTEQQFVSHFKETFIDSMPDNIASDKRLLVKHILDLYRSKGTQRSVELLFRILFNESIELYLPGNFIFKPSDAKWVVDRYIEVSQNNYLNLLIGQKIYNSKQNATAIVESYNQKIVNDKLINILSLSNINGNFLYGDKILCDSVSQIQLNNAPVIKGSLYAITIVNGGAGFKVGDILNVNGSGILGKARVSSTTNQRGKVSFNLIDGGFGYTTNAIVTVVSNTGTGASFKVGDITNKTIYSINTDVINDYYNTTLDSPTFGFKLNIANSTGNLTNGEIAWAISNTRSVDITTLIGAVQGGESLSNTALNINNLFVYKSDGNVLFVTGPDSALISANLVSNTILVSNTTSSVVKINSIFPKSSANTSATVLSANSTTVVLNNQTGYFVPTSILTGATSGNTSTITSTTRLTNWGFRPSSNTNLDTPLSLVLNTYDLTVGTISYITSINPGQNYQSNPTVTITEPAIYNLKIPDKNGLYYGYDALVTATSGNTSGIVTSADIYDSGYGYSPNELLTLTNANNISVSGLSVVGQQGHSSGYWADRKSFASDIMKIEDSDYYQIYSYEIIATRMKSTYENQVMNFTHPSGVKMFGKFKINSIFDKNTSIPVYSSINSI